MSDLAGIDLADPRLRADPHPTYHRLRAEAPVLEVVGPAGAELLLTRYEDCVSVLRDPRWSSNPGHVVADDVASPLRSRVAEAGLPVLLFMDPPDHTRLRRLVSKAFTPRTVERLRPRIADIFDGLTAGPAARGEMEVISELAYPLPVTVICEMLGVPVSDQSEFAGWSSDASRLLDGVIPDEQVERGLAAVMNFVAYFDQLFEERRRTPGDDLISRLLAVEDDGDALAHEELMATVLLLFVAGHETTMNLIGNGLLQLLRHRDQFDLLGRDPDLAPSAVEECLRFDGPVHLTGRVATVELSVAEHRVEPGRQVVTLLAAANRDPAVFEDPDRFDVCRADNHHLTFSHGLHYCLGAALARVEGQVVLGELARRWPGMELIDDQPALREHFILRGLESLHVSLPRRA
jgi:cytochrome P450